MHEIAMLLFNSINFNFSLIIFVLLLPSFIMLFLREVVGMKFCFVSTKSLKFYYRFVIFLMHSENMQLLLFSNLPFLPWQQHYNHHHIQALDSHHSSKQCSNAIA